MTALLFLFSNVVITLISTTNGDCGSTYWGYAMEHCQHVAYDSFIISCSDNSDNTTTTRYNSDDCTGDTSTITSDVCNPYPDLGCYCGDNDVTDCNVVTIRKYHQKYSGWKEETGPCIDELFSKTIKVLNQCFVGKKLYCISSTRLGITRYEYKNCTGHPEDGYYESENDCTHYECDNIIFDGFPFEPEEQYLDLIIGCTVALLIGFIALIAGIIYFYIIKFDDQYQNLNDAKCCWCCKLNIGFNLLCAYNIIIAIYISIISGYFIYISLIDDQIYWRWVILIIWCIVFMFCRIGFGIFFFQIVELSESENKICGINIYLWSALFLWTPIVLNVMFLIFLIMYIIILSIEMANYDSDEGGFGQLGQAILYIWRTICIIASIASFIDLIFTIIWYKTLKYFIQVKYKEKVYLCPNIKE